MFRVSAPQRALAGGEWTNPGLHLPSFRRWPRGGQSAHTIQVAYFLLAARWPISSHYSGILISIRHLITNQLTLFRYLTVIAIGREMANPLTLAMKNGYAVLTNSWIEKGLL